MPDVDSHSLISEESLGLNLLPGQAHYRAFVGPPEDYDLVAAMSFGLLTSLGMRQHHHVLDVGCGSLRVGRLLLPYLNRGCYTGLEPNAWLVADGISHEVGHDQIAIKKPRFVYENDARALIAQGQKYDFMLAQSIFSHCGPDLLRSWISQASELLTDRGALVATFIESECDNSTLGWIYPDCVSYRPGTLAALASRHGMEFVMLDWRHPRQSWILIAMPGFGADSIMPGSLSWNSALDRLCANRQDMSPRADT